MKPMRHRPLIAFFDYSDVFEDFYPHYGVDQQTFATRWAATANHALVSLLQREIGDVIWYEFSLEPKLSEARHDLLGCRIKFLPSSWLHRSLWRAFYVPKFSWRWRRAYPAYAALASYLALISWPFTRVLLRDRPDIFFLQDYATGRFDTLLLIARLLGVPLIAYHSGSAPERYIGRMAKQWTIPRADWLIVSSQSEKEMLASRYRVSPGRMRVILTPIDMKVFRPVNRIEACRAAQLDPLRRYFLFVGRLDDRVKRASALIQSYAAVSGEAKNIDLVIVGEGPDGERLRALAGDLVPGRVHFLGWVSGGEPLRHLYNAADCLVLPSLSEGFPTVVGEAMACGTPVLASRVGGVSELVVEGQTGWLIPSGDDKSLTAALSLVASQADIITAMRPRARAMAEARVSPAVVAAQLRTCFIAGDNAHGLAPA
ncbi:MAG: glycosyltransferase family 4 protein [Deltaproteobacteria bacterium]|nr:glycosyltransferase family 4 protein [Deltaproteobacteria bacterium]